MRNIGFCGIYKRVQSQFSRASPMLSTQSTRTEIGDVSNVRIIRIHTASFLVRSTVCKREHLAQVAPSMWQHKFYKLTFLSKFAADKTLVDKRLEEARSGEKHITSSNPSYNHSSCSRIFENKTVVYKPWKPSIFRFYVLSS
jgi:hypothetical protein